MKRYTILILLLLVVVQMAFFFTGCQQTSSPNPPAVITTQGNTKVYTNYEYGFSFTICNNNHFEVDENSKIATIALQGPYLADFKNRVGVYVIVKKAPDNMKLEDYLKENQKQAEKTLANFAIEKEETITIGGVEAKSISYTYTANLSDQDYTFKNTLIVFIKGNFAYVVKYETPDEFYRQYVECFDLLLSTFNFQ